MTFAWVFFTWLYIFAKSFLLLHHTSNFENFLEMFSPVHPTLKKELGTHGDNAIGMASTDKGVSVSFNKPKNVNDKFLCK